MAANEFTRKTLISQDNITHKTNIIARKTTNSTSQTYMMGRSNVVVWHNEEVIVFLVDNVRIGSHR